MHFTLIRELMADRRGGAAIMIAVMIVVIIGFTSLGAEVVDSLATQRRMQSAADSAAISAANAQQIGFPTDYRQDAYAIAAADGFVNGAGGVSVAVNNPPTSGHYSGQSGYVEVMITQPHALRLASLFYAGTFELHGHAVAQVAVSTGSCMLALAPTGTAISFSGNNGTVNYNNCAASVNSTDANAVSVGNGCLNATNLFTGGSPGYSTGPNGKLAIGSALSATCNSSPNPGCSSNANCKAGSPPALDPYANITTPSCGSAGKVTKGIATPGCYASGLGNASGLCPGVYVITGSLGPGNSSLSSLSSNPAASDYDANFAKDCPGNSGSGVTIFLLGANGNVSITGNGSLTLTPQTTGPYAGLLIYSPNGSYDTKGNGSANLTGAIVFPKGGVTFVGNGSDLGHACTEIIASTFTFTGNASVGADCAAFGTKPILQPAVMVE